MRPVTLDIQQPQPFDLVGQTILIAGNAVACEGTLTITVSDGHDEFAGFTTVGSLSLRQFQGEITIPDTAAFQMSRLFLTLADDTAREDGPAVIIPILYGPKILPGYTGYRPHTVRSGDTLSAIARREYGDANFQPIVEANQNVISNPDRIFVGQVLRIPRNDG